MNLRILVAEDNEVNQKVIRLILDKWGHSFDFAKDGIEVIEKFKTSQYDLVFMDCQMPNMDGLEAAHKIREIELNAHAKRTPIVAMTANAMKGDKEKCLAAGMDDFLAKPFKSGEVREKICNWVQKGRI